MHAAWVLAATVQAPGVGLTLQAVRKLPPVEAQRSSSVEPVGALDHRTSVQAPPLLVGLVMALWWDDIPAGAAKFGAEVVSFTAEEWQREQVMPHWSHEDITFGSPATPPPSLTWPVVPVPFQVIPGKSASGCLAALGVVPASLVQPVVWQRPHE